MGKKPILLQTALFCEVLDIDMKRGYEMAGVFLKSAYGVE